MVVLRAVPAANVATDRRRRFEIDPAIRFKLLREVRGGNETMIGHYHSHPNHPAVPSATDLAMAFEPDLLWLIIAVTADGAGPIAAFKPQPAAGRFMPLPVRFDEATEGLGDD